MKIWIAKDSTEEVNMFSQSPILTESSDKFGNRTKLWIGDFIGYGLDSEAFVDIEPETCIKLITPDESK